VIKNMSHPRRVPSSALAAALALVTLATAGSTPAPRTVALKSVSTASNPKRLTDYNVGEVVAASLLVPADFTDGPDSSGNLSPAGCRITNVQNPHVSTWYAQRGTVAVKGNAVANCTKAVPYLSLSVSVLDGTTHTVLAKNAKPREVTNLDEIESLETIVPCVNRDPTLYQVAALGVSQEDGKTYDQIRFGNVASANCGHA
jgi:hypothetical protein